MGKYKAIISELFTVNGIPTCRNVLWENDFFRQQQQQQLYRGCDIVSKVRCLCLTRYIYADFRVGMLRPDDPTMLTETIGTSKTLHFP
jgi:hypothetical protein